MKLITNISIIMTVFGTYAMAVVTSPAAIDTTAIASAQSSWWESPGNIIATAISLITLLGMMGAFLKKIMSANEMEPRLDKTEKNVKELKEMIDSNHKDLKDLMHVMKTDLANKVNVVNYNDLVIEHQELENKVNTEIDKLNTTVNELSKIEGKLNEVKSHFDDNNKERREEIKEINDTIKGLRENIREDINDVKAVIMKLMMNLKLKENGI